jgi:hypothetical protein
MKSTNDNIKAWVAALRSGQYKQTKEVLFNPETRGMCCLGVACDLYAEETGDGWWERSDGGWVSDGDIFYIDGDDGVYDILPPSRVAQWVGLSDPDGTLPWLDSRGVPATLSTLNDAGATFDQIADVIEYVYLKE